jgi:hypothetical protein
MLLSRYRLIYIHIPKSAGNSISHLLLPLSDDRMTVGGPQDGRERFELRGEVSTGKHMSLAAYREALGTEQFARYRVATVVRDPLDRALSYYFSPHRWMIEQDGQWRRREAGWSIRDFRTVATRMKRMVDFFEIDGVLRAPDHVVRFEALRSGFADLVTATGLPLDAGALPHVNHSTADAAVRTALRADSAVREIVAEHFARDFTLFGYPLPA